MGKTHRERGTNSLHFFIFVTAFIIINFFNLFLFYFILFSVKFIYSCCFFSRVLKRKIRMSGICHQHPLSPKRGNENKEVSFENLLLQFAFKVTDVF